MSEKFNLRFYPYQVVYPFLGVFKDNKKIIKDEVLTLMDEKWDSWNEDNLYNQKDGWTVFPFYGFGVWLEDNCKKCPIITSILQRLPGLKTASLSKLTSNTKLKPHKGWACLSNTVLRCQYGIIVHDKCELIVEEERYTMKEDDVVVFDDSKTHYAENNGSKDRIVLILDIERPEYVEKGTSDVNVTTDLATYVDIWHKKYKD